MWTLYWRRQTTCPRSGGTCSRWCGHVRLGLNGIASPCWCDSTGFEVGVLCGVQPLARGGLPGSGPVLVSPFAEALSRLDFGRGCIARLSFGLTPSTLPRLPFHVPCSYVWQLGYSFPVPTVVRRAALWRRAFVIVIEDGRWGHAERPFADGGPASGVPGGVPL